MATYNEVKINAENHEKADLILNSLLVKKMVTGWEFITTPAWFLCKGKVQDMSYVTITSYTTDTHKEFSMDGVRKTTTEEVPMMILVAPDDINKQLGDRIDETLA